jgi:HEAT repeat protein
MFREPRAKPEIAPAEAFEALGRGVPDRPYLLALSDLGRADRRALERLWPSLPETTRIEVIQRLTAIVEEDVQFVFASVFRAALGDESAVVRQLAVAGLWEDEGSDLIDLLIRLLEHDESQDVRAEAAEGLSRFAERAAAGEIDAQQTEAVRAALLDATSHREPSELVRRRALESLAVFGSHVAGGLIRDAYDSDDTPVRASAVYAMGRSLDRQWLPTVIAEFSSEDAELRYEAARASGQLGHADAVPGLVDLVADDDVEVRHAAIDALGKIGGPGAIRVLRALSGSAPAADRDAIEDALAEASLGGDTMHPA